MAGGSWNGGGGIRLAVALFVIFALVCFMGVQDLRSHRDREAKNAELDILYRDLQEARTGLDELQKAVDDLVSEKAELAAVKSNTSMLLIQSERNKQLLAEDKTRLEAALGDRDDRISRLKDQLKGAGDSEKQVARLRQRLRELEDQLELFKANTTTGSGKERAEEISGEKPQGEDLDHGLVAADKAEVVVMESDGDLEATKSEEVDDRKREQLDVESEKLDEDLDSVKAMSQDA